MSKIPKSSKDTRIGFYFVALYLLIILIFVMMMFTFKDGGWMLIPLSFITEFPFLFLIVAFLVLITGNEELFLIHTSVSSLLTITIGGIMNAFVLFMLGYFGSKLFRKRNLS
jgi:hypothetical protein